MNASHQRRPWARIQWSRRAFGLWTRGEIRTRFSHQQSTGQPGGGALSQFACFCVVGTSNAVIDVGVFNALLATFPTRATVPSLSYNTAAVVLAATNSFVWNRRFTFRVRGPLRAGEVARFAVVAARRPSTIWCCWLSPASFRRSWQALRLRANVLKLGLSWVPWFFRFSACEASCFSAGGSHLTCLHAQGVCPHLPGRTTLDKTLLLFKHWRPLLPPSSAWRYYHEYDC